MKKLHKKITALLLSALFIAHLVPVSAFATETIPKSATEALSFVKSKHFAIGEVVSTVQTDDGYLFGLKYLPSNEISYLNYRESSNGDIELTITEGFKTNTILFKSDGTVLFDGILTDAFDSANSSTYTARASYAVYRTNTLPSGFTESGFSSTKYGTVNPFTIALPIFLCNMTISALGSTIVSNLGWVNGESVAQNIASSLISTGARVTSILYCADVYRNNQQRPLQIVYKYVETWKLSGFPDWPYKTYRVEILL